MMGRGRHFFVLTPHDDLRQTVLGWWPETEVRWTVFPSGRQALEELLAVPPDLVLVDERLPDMSGFEVVHLIKSENVYRQVPVVVVVDDAGCLQGRDMAALELDDFLVRPLRPVESAARVLLAYHRAARELDANPLTKLPGNTSIIHRIQELIDRREDFALGYVDLDFFKAFNDAYGFARGDEVLLMTARVLMNSVRGYVQGIQFVGHVGGDDFVFIVPEAEVEGVCQRIIAYFDAIVPSFYDPEDRDRGALLSVDRQGRQQEFPIMAISIAVVFNRGGQLQHFGEASARAMELKKLAKKNPRSTYVLDQRS
jgi:GGDEF domain-containing protein